MSTYKYFAALLFAVHLWGQSPDRPLLKPGERILMIGDSITSGYGFGNYTDPSPLRTVYGTAELLMQSNLEHAPEFLRLSGGWKGLNADGTPIGSVDTLAGNIKFCIDKGD